MLKVTFTKTRNSAPNLIFCEKMTWNKTTRHFIFYGSSGSPQGNLDPYSIEVIPLASYNDLKEVE